MSALKLAGKVALITGGSAGIGLATAHLFAAEGANVIITGRNEAALQKAAQEIGNGCTAYRADASRLEEIDALIHRIKTTYGKLDILFVNAGISKFFTLENTTEQAFDEQVAVNFKGVFFTVQKAAPLFTQGGAIVLNASIGTRMGIPTASVYNATKAAVRSLGRTFAAELISRNIRVNVISPGTIDTDILYKAEGIDASQVPSMLDYYAGQIPMKRIGHPSEIARSILFLASDDSSYIIGSELVVDGGLLDL